MTTKEQIKEWAREEWVRLDLEKTMQIQAACTHARSGTIKFKTSIVVCDDCKKELNSDDQDSYANDSNMSQKVRERFK